MMERSEFISRVSANIASHGYHLTVVTGGELPRFAYTIGCRDTIGAEFIFAGGEYYSQAQVGEIIRAIASAATSEPNFYQSPVAVGLLGNFSLANVDPSWSRLLLSGAFDYYNQAAVAVWQIVPEASYRTLDIPNMSQVFEAASQPVWQWLTRKWDYPIPADSMAVSNLPMLFGARATEAMRWNEDDWEIFSGAGPDVAEEDRRMIPLGVLIGLDKSLEQVALLPIGKGLWRDFEELEWNDWG